MSEVNSENLRVAFQGERGAFSEQAAHELCGAEITLVPCATFEDLFTAIADDKADNLLVPVENSLAGRVARCHELMTEHPELIQVDEIEIPIIQSLIACANAELSTLLSVESHPVALAQCERFFAAHPQLKKIVADDTAASVRRVCESGDITRAAVGSRRAAEIYGGTILLENIADRTDNRTRFMLLKLRD